jgi:hypothetical protein
MRGGVDDWVLIEGINGGDDALLERLFRCDADVAQRRAPELGEEAFDEIEHTAHVFSVRKRRNPF